MYGSSRMKMSKPSKPASKPKMEKKSADKKISPAMMKRLKEHSKLHKGGMSSAHMKNMVKFVKEGMSFSAAHNKAVEIDKKKSKK